MATDIFLHDVSDCCLTLTTLGGAALRAADASPDVSTPDDVTPGVTTLGARSGPPHELPPPPAAPPPLLGPGKPLALIAYLEASPGRAASRAQLVDLLWAGVEPEPAKHALRQTLWYARQRTGCPLFITAGDSVRLRPDLTSDRAAFLAAVDAERLDDAVALYAGEFLPDVAVPGGADFERWADLERQRLRTTFARTAESLARRWLIDGRWRDAQALARRVRDAEPFDERGWRLLLEALASGGDLLAAAVEADRLEQLLAGEDREPEPATRAAIRLARRQPAAAPGADPSADAAPALVAELVGRSREFAVVLAAWESARRGGARHVHLLAPAGLGKSRLLDDLRARLRAMRARAVHVRAHPGGRQLGYALAGDLAAALAERPGAAGISPAAASALIALNPSLSAVFSADADAAGGDEALRRRTIAVAELIQAVAHEAPLPLLVDDLHWSDDLSQQLLAGALHRLGEAAVLVVTASRPAGIATALIDATVLELPPLDAEQVAALVASVGSLPREPWADTLPTRLADSAGGSPLLVMETLQLALERGLLTLQDGAWGCTSPDDLAELLREGGALRHRIQRLDAASAWLLLALAAAGRPVDPALLVTLARGNGDATSAALAALEQRGLVARAATGVQPAHDEIAAIALEVTPVESVRAAHRALAEAFGTTAAASDDATLHVRALQHALASGDEPVLRRSVSGVVASARRRADRRPAEVVVSELLGDRTAGDSDRLRRACAALPRRLRRGRTFGVRTAVAVAFVAGALLAAAGVRALLLSPTAPEAQLLVIQPKTGDSSWRAVPVRESNWMTSLPLQVTAGHARLDTWSGEANPQGTPNPVRPLWIVRHLMPDSGLVDMELQRVGGAPVRLTAAPGDDYNGQWSPDGRQVVFATMRWRDDGLSDLAIVPVTDDATPGRARRLTSPPPGASDLTAAWSPDGSRIAFSRHFFATLRPSEFCVVAMDGTGERCGIPSGGSLTGLLAWQDDSHVLVMASIGDGDGLAVVDAQTLRLHIIDPSPGARLASADARWIACLCREGNEPAAHWRVHPAGRPEQSRLLTAADGTPLGAAAAVRWDVLQPPLRLYLDRLRIVAPSGDATVGTTYQLGVDGRSASGQPVRLHALHWRVLDSAARRATVDSLGRLTARTPGRVRIEASAGGWRRDTLALAVEAPRDRLLFEEQWSGVRPSSRWREFGTPSPRLTAWPDGGRALLNNGDGVMTSGVYSVQAFNPARGLAIEAKLSTPVTSSHWQLVHVGFDFAVDSATLARADHSVGTPIEAVDSPVNCVLMYPAAEGYENANRILLATGSARQTTPLPGDLRERPYTVRLQLLPDGRCGLAVNGRPIAISRNTVPLDRSYRVILAGNSVGTQMLVGSLSLREGVPPGIDWNSLDH